MKPEDLTPSAKKAYKRHLQLSDKLFKRGQEAGKIDPNAVLYVDITDKPRDTWSSSTDKGYLVNMGLEWVKDKEQDWTSRHEIGHILEGHCEPHAHVGTETLEDMGDFETSVKNEISATIRGYGGPSKIPLMTAPIIKRYVEEWLPSSESWSYTKKMLREQGVPFKLLHKMEEKYGLKD